MQFKLGVCTLGLLVLGGCAVPTTTDPASEDPSDPTATGSTEQAINAPNYCDPADVDQVKGAYMRSFGRLPDTEEGAGFGELAYWCSSGRSTLDVRHIMAANIQWIKSNATSRTNTIWRSYRWAFGRDPQPCEVASWSNALATQGGDFVGLVTAHGNWAAARGWYCPQTPIDYFTIDNYYRYGLKCTSQVPFIGPC